MPTALVTGTSTGIGAACVARLTAAGWDVYAGVRRAEDGDRLRRTYGEHVRPAPPEVTDAQAISTARDVAHKEGIFCGISAGATVAAALAVAAKAPEGSVILAMLPDTGERYLSTALFEGVTTGSDTV